MWKPEPHEAPSPRHPTVTNPYSLPPLSSRPQDSQNGSPEVLERKQARNILPGQGVDLPHSGRTFWVSYGWNGVLLGQHVEKIPRSLSKIYATMQGVIVPATKEAEAGGLL